MEYQIKTHIGGISDGSRVGYEGSYGDGIGIDYRTDRDKLGVLATLKLDSGTVVTDLVMQMIEYNGDVWAYGDTGKIYRRKASTGTWEHLKTVSNSHGNGFGISNDVLWYAGDASLGKATNLTATTPTFTDDYFKSLTTEKSLGTDYSASNTYSLKSSLSETNVDTYIFTATDNNIIFATFIIQTTGTGNITAELHDNSNNKLASKTIAVADLGAAGIPMQFDFGKVSLTIGNSYHVHLYSNTTDGKVYANTTNDLRTAITNIAKYSNDQDLDQYNDITAQAPSAISEYVPPQVLVESVTDKFTFTPNVDLLAGISLFLTNSGVSGNTTLYLHNENNDLIASTTAVNVKTTSGDVRGCYYKFAFSSDVAVKRGMEYHVHIVTSVANAVKIGTLTASDFSAAGYKIHFTILASDIKYHPMMEFGIIFCIGASNFCATISDAEIYKPQVLVLPPGERVKKFDVIAGRIAIGTQKGTNIYDWGEGYLRLWDGLTNGYDGTLKFDGQINTIQNNGQNRLSLFHGLSGQISNYTGDIEQKRKIKGVGRAEYLEIYPNATCLWDNILRFAVSDGNSTVDRVVYSYGKKDGDQPNSLSKDYIISTGNKGSTVKIGALLGLAQDKFFVAWKDGTSYGIDIIDNTTDQASAYRTTIVYDGKDANRKKVGITYSIRFDPLLANQSIDVKYRIDGGTWKDLMTVTTTGKTIASAPLTMQFFDIEFKITLSRTGEQTKCPVIISEEFKWNFIEKLQRGNE